MKTAYITDSGTGRSISDLAQDGIISLPLQITDGTHTWQDMETLSKAECISLLEDKKVLMTSQPSPGLIDELFDSLKKNGTDLCIAVPICNGLSGTASTLTAMAAEYDMPLICVDTYSTAVVQDYLVHEIKKEYEEGKNDLEIRLNYEKVIDSCETIVIPVDLMSLARGGRLTPAAARMAKLLRIVPILHLNKSTGGRIDTLDKVLTLRKAMQRVISYMQQSPIDSHWSINIAHTNAIENAELLYHQITEAFPDAQTRIIELCNPVSAQAGLGCLAVQYFRQVQ